MMYIKLFDLKNEMLRSGEYLIDFSTNNFEVNFLDPFLKIQKIFLIEDKHLCRPDMISYDGYGDTDHIDAVLKFNQICNPFSMNIGDLILIPTDASLTRFYKNNATPSKLINNTKALFLDPTRASKQDLNRLNQLSAIAKKKQNGSSTPLPTNLLRPNEVPFKTDGSALIFAPSVSTPRFPTSNNSNINK